jgi:hypothetical protein
MTFVLVPLLTELVLDIKESRGDNARGLHVVDAVYGDSSPQSKEPEVCALRNAGRGESLKLKKVFFKLIVKEESLDINE